MRIDKEGFVQRVKDVYGERVEVLNFTDMKTPTEIIYKCKHGENRLEVNSTNLIRAERCYCKICRYPNLDSVYAGAKFGDWTVIEPHHEIGQTLCECKCGNERWVKTASLISGISNSCGCVRNSEQFKEVLRHQNKKYNKYEINDYYVVMYTSKNEPFYVSLEDFDKVKNICWCKNDCDYLTGNIGNNQIVLLHRYITDCPNGKSVDHINMIREDNRRSNLRICSMSENHMNKGLISTNTSGAKGVYWSKSRNKWIAQIGYDKRRCKYLGSFDNIDDAIKARQEAEMNLYGDFLNGGSSI